jgi:pSer/pThr/pTyr-binding forkhead associated (FHA) protein
LLRGERGSLSIGRDQRNDLVLASPCASRFHARIEWRKRAFYIIDRSTNGTMIVREGGRTTVIRRQGLRIHGSGTLGVGGSPEAPPEEPIRFEFRDVKTGA